MRVFDEILAPVARRYSPELIIVSAGYDAHMADPIGGMAVSTAGFYRLAERVRSIAEEIAECGGRVACVLEGGYNVQALAASVVATIAAFEKSPQAQEVPDSMEPDSYRGRRAPDISQIINEVRRIHGL
jgi:acetoin utilization deacetylase AcuC-like enzyme